MYTYNLLEDVLSMDESCASIVESMSNALMFCGDVCHQYCVAIWWIVYLQGIHSIVMWIADFDLIDQSTESELLEAPFYI